MERGKAALAAAALAASLVAVACGQPSSVFPEVRPEDYPPIKTTLLNEPFALAPGTSAAIDFQVPDTGDVVATVDWTYASNEVLAVFAGRSCPSVNHALAGSCNQGVFQAPASTCPAKPRIIAATVVGGAPVRLYVANTGPAAESGRVQITQCRDAPGCAAGMACGQCSLEKLRSCP
jgi:hypothetical protein